MADAMHLKIIRHGVESWNADCLAIAKPRLHPLRRLDAYPFHALKQFRNRDKNLMARIDSAS